MTHVLDFNNDPLPFEDASVDAIWSAHCFEHVKHPKNILGEMLRVCKDGAKIELWMPYGHSNDAFVCGHDIFYTELQWQHFINHYADHWTPDINARYRWERVRYHLMGGVFESMKAANIPLPFAIKHFVNVAWEFGLFLTVERDKRGDAGAPRIEFGYGREGASFT